MEPIPAPDQAKASRPDCKLVAMGPPRGVSDDDCGTAEMLISPMSEELPGFPARRQYAYYRPNEAELAHLAAGGFIEFCQYGQVVQPFSATIWAPADVQNELRRQILEGDVPTQDCADPETHDPHVIVTEGDDGEEQKRFCTGNGQAALP